MSLMKHTAYRVDLSVNIITRRNGQERLTTLNIMALTGLILWLWAIGQTVNAIRFDMLLLAQDVTQAASIAGKLLLIVLSAAAFALGVKI